MTEEKRIEEVRICNYCPLFYDPTNPEARTDTLIEGRCYLFDSVDPLLRNLSAATFSAKEHCRFKLGINIDLSRLLGKDFIRAVNNSPASFRDVIKYRNIRFKQLMDHIAQSSSSRREVVEPIRVPGTSFVMELGTGD